MYRFRHYIIEIWSNYQSMMVERLLEYKEGIIFTFDELDEDKISDLKHGIYDIFIDTKKLPLRNLDKELLDWLKDYEMVELHKKEYNSLKDYAHNIPFKDILSIYKEQIEEKVNNAVAEKVSYLEAKKIEELYDMFHDEIEKKIKNEADARFMSLVDSFENKQCSYDDLCGLYKHKLKAEVTKRVELIMKYASEKSKPYLSYFDNLKFFKEGYELYNNTWERDVFNSELGEDIRRQKNKIVDDIVKLTLTRRGMKEYNTVMLYAGKTANDIEHLMYTYISD